MTLWSCLTTSVLRRRLMDSFLLCSFSSGLCLDLRWSPCPGGPPDLTAPDRTGLWDTERALMSVFVFVFPGPVWMNTAQLNKWIQSRAKSWLFLRTFTETWTCIKNIKPTAEILQTVKQRVLKETRGSSREWTLWFQHHENKRH